MLPIKPPSPRQYLPPNKPTEKTQEEYPSPERTVVTNISNQERRDPPFTPSAKQSQHNMDLPPFLWLTAITEKKQEECSHPERTAVTDIKKQERRELPFNPSTNKGQGNAGPQYAFWNTAIKEETK
jgi:hypothetical protein